MCAICSCVTEVAALSEIEVLVKIVEEREYCSSDWEETKDSLAVLMAHLQELSVASNSWESNKVLDLIPELIRVTGHESVQNWQVHSGAVALWLEETAGLANKHVAAAQAESK